MTPARFLLGVAACFGLAAPAAAQNLLTRNPSFEVGDVFLGGGLTNSDNVPGWFTTTAAGTGGVASDQPLTAGRDGLRFGYLRGAATASTMSTAPGVRPAVAAGQEYRLSFLALNDTNTPGDNGAVATLAFYDAAGAVLGSQTRTGIAPFGANPSAGTTRTFQPFELSAVAPAGSASAGVSFGTFGTHVFDNFVLVPVPEPAGLLLAGGLAAGVWRWRRGASPIT